MKNLLILTLILVSFSSVAAELACSVSLNERVIIEGKGNEGGSGIATFTTPVLNDQIEFLAISIPNMGSIMLRGNTDHDILRVNGVDAAEMHASVKGINYIFKCWIENDETKE